MSGRDLFTYNPELVVQDEGDMEGGVAFEREFEEEDNDEVFIYLLWISFYFSTNNSKEYLKAVAFNIL